MIVALGAGKQQEIKANGGLKHIVMQIPINLCMTVMLPSIYPNV